jgi:hypothetical protein
MDNLPLNVVLDEIAAAYETVAALAPAVDASGCRRCNEHGPFREGSPKERAREVHQMWHAMTVNAQILGGRVSAPPGSRVPPGLSEALDEDEYSRAVRDVDEWAEFVVHVLIDETPGIGSVPYSTPGRLRLAAQWAALLEAHPDAMLRYALLTDAAEHLATMRRLARRGTRRVRTESACLNVTCSGKYATVIDGAEADGDLVCSGCGDRVPLEMWEKWGSRAKWSPWSGP